MYVLGVEGDAQVVTWSAATIGSMPFRDINPSAESLARAELEHACRNRSKEIIRAKGSCPFGLGSVVCSICSSILLDKRNVRPISHFQPEFGCCFSMPAVLGRTGITRTIKPPMSSEEEAGITESAKALRHTIDRLQEN